MSLQQLRAFVEVYRQRSISAAARNLALTQPAVSQQIASLEAAIGRQLFERRPRGVMPTAPADELAADLGDKLDQAEAALSGARARSSEIAGAIQIVGHCDFLAEAVAPQLLPLLEAGMRVRLQSGDAEAVRTLLVDGQADLGVSAKPIDDRRLRSEVLHVEDVLAVAAPAMARRIAGGADLGHALAREPLLAYNLERPMVDRWLKRNGLNPRETSPSLIGQDLRALRAMAMAGGGWTALPLYLCAEALTQGLLAEIVGPVGRDAITYYLVWSSKALRNPRIALARQKLIWRFRPATRGAQTGDVDGG